MEEKTHKKNINKTWILIFILAVITFSLLGISITAKNKIYKPIPPKDLNVNPAKTSLYFSDEVRNSSNSGTYELDLKIDTKDNKINLAQLEMIFEPNSISKVDIKPGNFIKNPVIIQKSINPETGRIKYWIGIFPNETGISGQGTLAILSFTKVGTSSSSIEFLPKTSISADGIKKSVLSDSKPGIVKIIPTITKPPFLRPSTSPTLPQ